MAKISYFGKQNSTLGSAVPLAMFIKMDVKVMKLETGQLMSEGVRNSFHSCCFDSDLDNTAPSKQSELQLSSS